MNLFFKIFFIFYFSLLTSPLTKFKILNPFEGMFHKYLKIIVYFYNKNEINKFDKVKNKKSFISLKNKTDVIMKHL